MKQYILFISLITAILFTSGNAYSNTEELSKFHQFDKASSFEINYQDYQKLLRTIVLDVGFSERKRAPKSESSLGSRVKKKRNIYTALESNRVNYKELNKENNLSVVTAIRKSLESLPGRVPLKYFNEHEQIAFWLNLYNITVIEEVSKLYPKPRIGKDLYASDGILNKKLLTVDGVALSLNDIHYKIINKLTTDKLSVLYGMSHGIIGSPRLSAKPFTGKTLHSMLDENAEEFVNSNRGTFVSSKTKLRVSNLYEINESLFDEQSISLKSHLLEHAFNNIEGYISKARSLTANIKDHNMNSIFGKKHSGSSSNTNSAALLDAAAHPDAMNALAQSLGMAANFEGGFAVNVGAFSEAMTDLGDPSLRVSPELLILLKKSLEVKEIKEGEVKIKKSN